MGLMAWWIAGRLAPSPKLSDAHWRTLTAMIEAGLIPAIHGVVRWHLVDLCQWLWEEFGISLSKSSMSREVRALGYRKLSARPRHHAQADGAMEYLKTYGPARLQAWLELAMSVCINVSGLRGEPWPGWISRVPGPHKSSGAPHDQRTASTHIFGAICPKEGKGAVLVLPHCHTQG